MTEKRPLVEVYHPINRAWDDLMEAMEEKRAAGAVPNLKVVDARIIDQAGDDIDLLTPSP